jgi:RNA polymerase sigma-70 factor (ECF subfamily)
VPSEDSPQTISAPTLGPSAFDRLVKEYRPRLKAYCARFLRDESDAEDAAMEALENAWSARESYRGEVPIERWVFTIARNVCNNTLRTKKDRMRRASVSIDDPYHALVNVVREIPDTGPSPEQLALMSALCDALRRKLSTEDYLILVWHNQGMSDAEIAKSLPIELNLGVHGVRSRLQRSIKKALAEVGREFT